MFRTCKMFEQLERVTQLLVVVLAALVGGAPRVVSCDFVLVLLQAVVLRAVVRVAVDRVWCRI